MTIDALVSLHPFEAEDMKELSEAVEAAISVLNLRLGLGIHFEPAVNVLPKGSACVQLTREQLDSLRGDGGIPVYGVFGGRWFHLSTDEEWDEYFGTAEDYDPRDGLPGTGFFYDGAFYAASIAELGPEEQRKPLPSMYERSL